jgi:hypothetical protein
MIAAHRAAALDELHAPASQIGDPRQIDVTAVSSDQPHEWGRVELGGQGCVDRNAQARSQIEGTADMAGDGDGCHSARRGRNGPAQLLQALAQGRAVVNLRIQGATRRCRYEPLPSNLSNKVGQAEGGKAFRSRSRTCTILPTSPIPGCLN